MTAVLKDDTELFKQFSDNESFKKWLSASIFAVTYEDPGRNRPDTVSLKPSVLQTVCPSS